MARSGLATGRFGESDLIAAVEACRHQPSDRLTQSEGAGSTGVSADGGNTLIVDDEGDVRLLLQLLIDREDKGLRVVGQAESGNEALTMRRDLDVDVVVLDHRMPGLTGLETATAMLAEEPDLPIVLYSAFADRQMVAEAREIGVRECVEKGDVPRLIAVLRELTGLQAS
jgi:CheY-like chemotaxis protein